MMTIQTNAARVFRFVTCVALVLSVALVGGCGKSAESMLSAAKESRAKGDLQAAVLQLKSLLQETPDHPQARFLLGALYNETGDFRSAEKELRRALELKVEAATLQPELARSLFMQGEFKKVLDEIGPDGISDADALASVLSVRGNAHLALRQSSDARASFERALAAKPNFSEAILGQARLAATEKDLPGALALVDKAIAADPKHADAWLMKGDMLRAQGKAQDAAGAYSKLIEARPDHVGGLLALASLEIVEAKFDDAIKRIEAVRKKAPGNPMAVYFQALIEFRRGNNQAAREHVLQVLKAAPTHLPSNLLAGAVEFALGGHEQAQARLRFVLERTPTNLYARRLLAASLTRTGQSQKAIEVLDPALKQAPDDAVLLALAGEVQMQMNEFGKAREYFERAAKGNPNSPGFRTGLGLSRLAAGDVERATADLESASQLDTGKTRADVLLVSTHLQRGAHDQALKAAENLLMKQPENPLSHNLVAAAYIGKKDFANARKALEQALKLQPGYYPAAANLAQIDLQDGDAKTARKRLEDLVARDRSNVQALIGLATFGARIGATPQEIQGWLEAARKASPAATQPLVMLARFFLQSGESKKALEVVEQALAAAPDNPEILDTAAQVQLAAGDHNRALATYGKLVTAQPLSPIALVKLANAQAVAGNEQGAAGTLRKAIAMRADFVEAQIMLGELEIRAKRPAEALRIAQTVQKQNPRSPAGWVLEGDALMSDRKAAQAVKSFETAQSLGRSSGTAMKLHVALSQSGRGPEGEGQLAEWIRQNPRDLLIRMFLAEILLKSNRHARAAEQYEFVVKEQPENLVALNNLAWSYQQTKDKRALETAEKALKLRPGSPAVLDTVGMILVTEGQHGRGIELLRKAVAGAPKSPEIRLNLAQGLATAGERSQAREQLEKLLLDFPEFTQRDKALALLKQVRG